MKPEFVTTAIVYMLTSLCCCEGWHLWKWRNRFKGCRMDLNWDVNHLNQPIFTMKGPFGYDLLLPSADGLQLPYDKEMYVLCPGENNKLKDVQDGEQVNRATCYARKTLRIKNHLIKSKVVMCENEVTTEIQRTNRKCANGLGEEIEVGYDINGMMPILNVCYNVSEVKTIYSINILHGNIINSAESRMFRPRFIVGPKDLYPEGFDIHNTYKFPQQKSAFRQQLGMIQGDMMTSQTYLARGHLASAKDFIMGTWQFSSYAYVNLIPQWQSINIGHWYQMEKSVRRLANLLKEDFVIATGTYGVMTAKNVKKEKVNLYLDPDRKLLPIPDTLWKIVTHPKNMSCIVFIIKNNPFMEDTPKQICDNICEQYYWPSFFISNWRGYMYCCTYKNFKGVVTYAPELQCNSVLTNIPEPDDSFQALR